MERFKNLFSGRISRGYYFLGTIAFGATVLLLNNLILKPLTQPLIGTFLGGIIALLAVILIFTFFVSMDVRRLHDIGRSGWWTLLSIILPLNLLLFIFLSIFPGNRGSNKYGKQPKPLYF